MPDDQPKKYLRKIIRIRAEDSPNVRRARYEIDNGLPPTGKHWVQRDDKWVFEDVVPGVLSWEQYVIRRKSWDKVRQCVGLDAAFYRGAELLLYPPEWLNLAERRWELLRGQKRIAKGIGIDPAEGGDSTSMGAVDEWGLIELVSRKTPDTDDIPREAAAFMKRHKLFDKPERVCFDRGGGGKQHADRMRKQGLRVRTVGFGENMTDDPKAGTKTVSAKRNEREGRYEFKNRRAQLFGELSEWLDPGISDDGPRFALPPPSYGDEYVKLRHEMAPIPKTYTKEGTLYLLPKHHDPSRPRENQVTLVSLIGWSPDRLDAVTLAAHAMLHDAPVVRAGAASWG